MIMVAIIELALCLVIITTQPSDELSLGLYSLLIIGELLAVSLLPPSSVFFTAIYNIAFTIGSVLLLHHTPTLTQAVHQQLATIIARPVAVQFLVAAVSYIWVNSTLRAISRADRAEVIASLERQITRQSIQVAEEKQHLEENINQIVQSHIDTMNNKVVTRIPFSEETKILWPLINVIDSLQKRLRTALQTEYELQRIKKAISGYTNLIYSDRLTSQQPWPQTKTDLDPLIYAIRHKDHLHVNNAAEQRENLSLHKWRGTYPRSK